jgi:hypothetical protein
MRSHRMGLGIASSIVLAMSGAMIAQTPALSQEDRGTPEQQLACTPDVFRLCGEMIPDANRITACLRQNTPQLSGPCRAVFEPMASMPQQMTPRARGNLPRPYDIRPRTYGFDDQ